MGKVNTPLLISAIACLIAAIGFFFPWGMAYYEAGTTTQTITLYGTSIIVEISYEAFWTSITGIGSGGCEMEGTLTAMMISGDYEADIEFVHDLGVIGIAGLSLNFVAFVLLLLASLGLPISPVGMRYLGYAGLVALVVGLAFGLIYLGILYAGLGELDTETEIEIRVPNYPLLHGRREGELAMEDVVRDADALFPGYGFILSLIMWATSLACFVKGKRGMTIAPPLGAGAEL